MIEIKNIPDKAIQIAQEKAKKLGVLKNSIEKGDGNVAGFLGQLLVRLYLNGEDDETYDYDVVKDKIRYEVKTKRCKFKPREDYTCSVCAKNARQDCDYYVFVRVTYDYKNAWILGKKAAKSYLKESLFCKKGEKDPDSDFGWTFKEDCFNLKINQLDNL